MSWLLNSIPYVLAGATIFLGIFQLVKEWDEYEKLKFPWLRKAVLAALVLIGVLTFVSLHFDNKAKAEEKSKSEGDIKELKTKVQAANDAQTDNTKLFLGSFDAMSKEVGDLKADVRTEALQKKLTSVESDLQKTQKALAPGPKAELTFTFSPFINPQAGQPVAPVTDVTLPTNPDGSVHVEFTVLNTTGVNAANVELNFQICNGCRYAKEPANFSRLSGMKDVDRNRFLPRILAMQAQEAMSADVIPPPFVQAFDVGFNYRCSSCIVPKVVTSGTVHISDR